MPDYVFYLLTHYANEVWMAFLGVLGGSVRIATGISSGEKMPPAQIFATLVTGGVLSVTSAKMFASWIGMGPEATNFCGFIVGIMGMNIVTHIIEADVAGALLSKFKLKP